MNEALAEALALPATQAVVAEIVGVSEARMSQLVREDGLVLGGTVGEGVLAYCHRIREQAAGRLMGGQASLMAERAALTRSQREEQDRKNAVARGEFAPIGLLADVLGAASAAVRDRFDQLDGALRKACPDLPESARVSAQETIASARNEWVRATAALVEVSLSEPVDEDDDGGELEPA